MTSNLLSIQFRVRDQFVTLTASFHGSALPARQSPQAIARRARLVFFD